MVKDSVTGRHFKLIDLQPTIWDLNALAALCFSFRFPVSFFRTVSRKGQFEVAWCHFPPLQTFSLR